VPLPRLAYLVCATPRSGSTLLCRSLAATGVAGRPEEYFERLRHSGLPREPREYFGGLGAEAADLLELLPETRTGRPQDADLERELPRYLEEGTTPNGVFGSKLMWGYLDDLLARLAPGSLEDRLGPLRYVHVTREDKVAQAVSLWRAVQTRAWSAAEDPGRVTPVYDRRGIAHLEQRLTEEDDAWREWFAERGIAPHTVVYEAFVADHGPTIRRVLDFLGIEGGRIPNGPPLERQGDARSARWAERYRAERSVAR
jgi:trehalose 2-sulfotransferase